MMERIVKGIAIFDQIDEDEGAVYYHESLGYSTLFNYLKELENRESSIKKRFDNSAHTILISSFFKYRFKPLDVRR